MTTRELLQPLLDEGRLAGWVAGRRDRNSIQISTGGRRSLDGPPMTEDTQFAITSCSKPIAGVLTSRLAELELIDLDEPIARWVPEFAAPRVLTAPDGPLTDTVPAESAITVRQLLTMTSGLGWVDGAPLTEAMAARSVAPGPFAPPMTPDEYVARLAELPLADQPGTAWRYHTSSDLLGVVLERATGEPLDRLLDVHVCGRLGMTGTGFVGDPDRLATAYTADDEGRLVPYDVPAGLHTTAPEFQSLACGLLSTVPDQLAFLGSLLGHGPAMLSPASVTELRTNALGPSQLATAAGMLEPGSGWGLHVEVRPDGRFGWAGGLGGIGYADPATGRAAVLHTQLAVDAPAVPTVMEAFWSLFDE
ncbi:serine hydrolase domain-containing protein [Microlunatus sp. Y2014]|uniref:serine hydrolase domain-containing protein n=1 Tax=Microlunatus sp. Y2014 TaxID=3418488 RepID=UPI003DA7802B